MRLTPLLILLLLASAPSNAAEPTSRIRSEEGWWTPPVVLDTVRGGWLVFLDGSSRDSMQVGDVDVIRRTRTSHVAGALLGFGAGLTGALLLLVPYGVARAGIGHSSGDGSDLPLIIGGASIVVGTTWGAIGGLDVHPTDDLSLSGLDVDQRSAALRRFILDTHLQRSE